MRFRHKIGILRGKLNKPEEAYEESYFDGTIPQLIGYSILTSLLTLFTFGIGFPWALCILKRWETSHTVIESKRLKFDGTGLELLGLWFALVLIPFGALLCLGSLVFFVMIPAALGFTFISGLMGICVFIAFLCLIFCYGFFATIQVKKWVVSHIEFEVHYMPYSPQSTVQASSSPRSEPSRPVAVQPCSLKSEELVHADGMIAYCEWFRFDIGASKELCRRLFEKAEPSVSPDKEVVMTFMSIRDYISQMDNGGPCACVFGTTKFLIASDSRVETIQVADIEGFSMERRGQQPVITLRHRDGSVALYADSGSAPTLLTFCKVSLDACKKELEELAKT